MRTALALWRIARLLLQVVCGMAVMALRFPALDAAGRQARIGDWSAGVLRVMGLTLTVTGQPHRGATLLVANHLSWLDIMALHAAMPQARFVAKADVQRWPLLGRLVAGAGTLFIERERKRDALRVVHAIAASLQAGDTVAVFPEGVVGPGPLALPFHANLIQAAISTGTPIQPAALRYVDTGSRPDATGYGLSPAVFYAGAITLGQSLWRVALAQGLAVQVDLLPPEPSDGGDRRALAERLQGLINQHLQG